MLNPAPRATIVSALLQPHTFLSPPHDDPTTQRLPIWKLPDTSILFRRYLEAGRMINVYDWYESFSQVIESQRSHLAHPSAADGGQNDDHGHGEGEEEEDEDEEGWKMHVQSRFIRALHTLDFVGLIKHTGRKAEHVMRTVYDVPE
jgi:origin recognition complex subunit 3